MKKSLKTLLLIVQLLFYSVGIAWLCSMLAAQAAGATITRYVDAEQLEITGVVTIDTTLGEIVWADLVMPAVSVPYVYQGTPGDSSVWMPGHVAGAGRSFDVLDSQLDRLDAVGWFAGRYDAPAYAWISPEYQSGAYTAHVGLIFTAGLLNAERDYYAFDNRFYGRLPTEVDFPLVLQFQTFIYGRSPTDSSSPYLVIGGLSIVPEPSTQTVLAAGAVVLAVSSLFRQLAKNRRVDPTNPVLPVK